MMFDSVPACGISAAICACQSNLPNVKVHAQAQPKKSNSLKIKFSPEEDQRLLQLVMQNGAKDWIKISTLMETRNPRQCRERWNNYLNPALRTDPFTPEEDILLDQKYAEYGPRWNKISKFFHNRSDNSLRNRWMMIARHRAKSQKSPISPAPNAQVRVERPRVVMPVVKEFKVPEVKALENSFEMLNVPTVPVCDFDVSSFDFDNMWNDFSFY